MTPPLFDSIRVDTHVSRELVEIPGAGPPFFFIRVMNINKGMKNSRKCKCSRNAMQISLEANASCSGGKDLTK